MTTVLSTTGTIFFIIAIGYLAVDRKVFSREALQVLGKYVVNLASTKLPVPTNVMLKVLTALSLTICL